MLDLNANGPVGNGLVNTDIPTTGHDEDIVERL